MTGSMACGPRSISQAWGFKEAEQTTMADRWFKATTVSLNLANFTACHSIYSVQAIATLTIAAHMLSHSNRQSVLLASAIRVAQSLGLHRLGHETGERSSNLVKREIGRRVWSQLCVQDWFSIPFSETYLIHDICFDTAKPRNCHEEDMHSLSDDIPTDMGYNRLLYDIAALMPQLQDGLTSSNTLYTKYEQVLQYDTQMRALATKHVPYYLKNVLPGPSWPCHVPWARRSLAISLSHKIIMIHRKFLGLSFSNPAFQFTRKTCIAASKNILKEQKQAVNDGGPVLWIYRAFSVAASIILCLDIFHRSPSDKEYHEHRKMVEDSIEILSHCEISMIAKRSVSILGALLAKEQTSRTAKWDELESYANRLQPNPAYTLGITEFIQKFCEQERRNSSSCRRRRSSQAGWPPSDVNLEAESGYLGNPRTMSEISMASSTMPSAFDVSSGLQSFGYRHSGDELFSDLMASQSGDSTTTPTTGNLHSWEDILFLAQNYVV